MLDRRLLLLLLLVVVLRLRLRCVVPVMRRRLDADARARRRAHQQRLVDASDHRDAAVRAAAQHRRVADGRVRAAVNGSLRVRLHAHKHTGLGTSGVVHGAGTRGDDVPPLFSTGGVPHSPSFLD